MRYFAYGANMDRAHMSQAAPGATVIGVATIADHRLTIGHAGFGTLVPASGGRVCGLVWNLTPTDEKSLDQFEGIDRGFYRKAIMAVTTSDGTFDAMVYLAVDARPGKASPDYLRQVVAGARAAGFPADYLAELVELPEDACAAGPWIPPSGR